MDTDQNFIRVNPCPSVVNRMKRKPAIEDLLKVMARLHSPRGCPWDRQQDHRSIRWHAVEEAYELIDAIEAGDDHEMVEELGDLLLQVVFHCQLARERGAFDFENVARRVTDKLIRRHPHVFGDRKLKSAEAVLTQWEQIKRAEKLVKKARKAELLNDPVQTRSYQKKLSKTGMARQLFLLTELGQGKGWLAEEILLAEVTRNERAFRRFESAKVSRQKSKAG